MSKYSARKTMMRVIQLAMATVLTFAGSAVFAGSQNAAMLDRIFVDLRDAPDFTLRSVENGNNEIVGAYIPSDQTADKWRDSFAYATFFKMNDNHLRQFAITNASRFLATCGSCTGSVGVSGVNGDLAWVQLELDDPKVARNTYPSWSASAFLRVGGRTYMLKRSWLYQPSVTGREVWREIMRSATACPPKKVDAKCDEPQGFTELLWRVSAS